MTGKISRRAATAAILGAAAFPSVIRRASAAPEPPNLLFILADDMVFRAMGCAGNSEIETPNLDRLAREGTRFTRCHVSNPICTPSRATILTGQYGFRNGVTFFGMPIREDSPRLPRLLNEAGYHTGYTGKWHNNSRPHQHGFQHMRHVFLGGMHGYDDIPVVEQADDKPSILTGQPSTVFTDAALELLQASLQEPYCLFVCHKAPHDPRNPPPEYEAMYPPEKITLPANFMREPRFDPLTLHIRDELLHPRPFDPELIRRETGKYYGLISHLDSQVGRLLDHLEKSGQLERTVIVFASDNGLTLGAHGLLGKQTLYEEGVRVPLILRGPRIAAGRVCDALVDLMDLFPTFLDFAGAPIPAEVQGHSLRPLLAGEKEELRDSIFCHYEDYFRMVRTPSHKLVRHLKTGREELFELEADPFELQDLSGSPEHTRLREALGERLDRWRKEIEAV